MVLRRRHSAPTRRSAGGSGESAPPIRSRACKQTRASGERSKSRATLSVMNTSARDLSIRLADLLRNERAAMADFLVALADFDRRRLWVELGYSSLFYFLHRELGLSKGAAFYRKTAAELIERCPEVVEPLRAGHLCLTGIVELAKVLTPENRDEVLPRFFHASKAGAKAVSAELQPDLAPPRRDVVTPLPTTALEAHRTPDQDR